MKRPSSIFGWLTQYRNTAPWDVIGLCNAIGIQCETKTLSDNVAGSICKLNDNKYQILVNKQDTETKQRFTIAHLLGHFYLHRQTINFIRTEDKRYTSEANNFACTPEMKTQEKEANAFAADLLMPKDKIEKYLNDGYLFSDIQTMLKVSESALRFRLETLKLPIKHV